MLEKMCNNYYYTYFLGSCSSSPNPKSHLFDTLTVKQCKIMINNDVLLFSATKKETPYEQLLHYSKEEVPLPDESGTSYKVNNGVFFIRSTV